MMLRIRRKSVATVAAVLGMSFGLMPILNVPTASAQVANPSQCAPVATTALSSLCVESSSAGSTQKPYNTGIHKGDRITPFKWLVNDDSTGDPTFDAAHAAACLPSTAKVSAAQAAADPSLANYISAGDQPLSACTWPSVHSVLGHTDVVTNGTDKDVAALSKLPDGKYLLSVTALGYKIDGVHFEVQGGAVYSVNEEVGKPFIVRMNPLPKKTATVRVHVYNDNASTNGQWDGQTETLVTCADATPAQRAANCGGSTDPNLVGDPSTDMSGFSVQITDVLNPVTTDVYGSPLCTQYQTDADGNVVLNADGSPNPIQFGDKIVTQNPDNTYSGHSTGSVIPHDGGASGSMLAGTNSSCISDHYGDIVIPNMGPNRYAATVIPPDPATHNGAQWVQTTTLEGGHDWDTWNIEGGTGYDTELIVGGERVSPVAHGFVQLTHNDQVWQDAEKAGHGSALEQSYYNAGPGFSDPAVTTNKLGTMTGTIAIGRAYIGSGGQQPLAGTNLANAKKDGVIEDGLISINCIATCNAPTDSAVWVGRARTDGTFNVTGLETGDYSVAFWDETQNYILAVLQYHVYGDVVPSPNPQNLSNLTKVGDILLPGWFTDLQGSIFNDLNGDGIRNECDPKTANCTNVDPRWKKNAEGVYQEPGIPDFVLTVRTRGNSLQDQGAAKAKTNDEGTFDLSQGYPLGQFLIVEAYNPRYKNTGFTYSTDNDPTPHTVHTAQVDANFLPIIGLSAHLDWGMQAYGYGKDYYSGSPNDPTSAAAPKDENGGIVGTVTYDVTRNELNPAYAVQEDYQPGIAGIPMQLWGSKKDPITGKPVTYADGSARQYGTCAGSCDFDAGGLASVPTTSGRLTDCVRHEADRGTDAVNSGQGCKPYDYYVSESWQRPVGCKALDINGNHLTGEMALPVAPTTVDYAHNPDVAGLTPAQSADCVESPMSGFQIGGNGTVDGNFALNRIVTAPGDQASYDAANGDPSLAVPLPSGDYIVEAVNPRDTVNTATVTDPTNGGYIGAGAPKKKYRFTDETVVNIFSGDTYVPQEGFIDGANQGRSGSTLKTPSTKIRKDTNSSTVSNSPAFCAGALQTLPTNTDLATINPDMAAHGGSPYAGRSVPVCDSRIVRVVGGRSINPGFFMYTDVPVPSKFYGLMNDDLNVNVNRRSVLLGEVAPVSNGPVGIYDENGNWKFTAHTDVNGFYEVILPSMDTYNCPLPAGPCPNVYRLVGNDPGNLAHKNLDYNPQFRTIATEFQAWTGVIHPVDQAPTHQGITIEGPAAQFGALSLCKLAANNPVIFALGDPTKANDRPYYDPAVDSANRQYTIQGSGFRATINNALASPPTVMLGSTAVNVVSSSDTTIVFTIPTVATLAPGPYQLSVKASNGLSTVNGLTFHVLGAGYLTANDVFEVTPVSSTGTPLTMDTAHQFTPIHDAWDPATNTPAGFSGLDVNKVAVGNPANTSRTSGNGRAIQRAIQAAYNAGHNGNDPKLVVIYPNTADNYAPHNPNAAYFENVVVHGKVKLQGVGPGGSYSSTSSVYGTNIDASQFWSATQIVPPGGNQQTSDGSYSDDWRVFANGLPNVSSTTELPEGEGILAIAEKTNQYANLDTSVGDNDYTDLSKPKALFQSGVDGVLISGGDQQGNPGNINTAPGAIGDTVPGPVAPGPSQGGAIMLDQYVRDFNITNNLIQSNGGTYGTVRIGTPDLPGSPSNHNERLNVANNRFVANGGTNLAGALGLFYGTDKYTVTGNDFCGNFSAEYGGAISHYGASPGGTISKNRIYYNQGYDEGGGIMIAGNLPANNNALSDGAGGRYVNGFTGTGNGRQPVYVVGGVTIDSNTLISNQSNDDGGGIRFLMAGDWPAALASSYPANGVPFLVQNNIIANNLSTHEGGGVALDDTPNATLVNNTIVKNITTGTAATNAALGSGIKPANPAGLSTGGNSAALQALQPLGSPNWSRPNLVNNIFADNRAGWAQLPTNTNFNQSAIHGIGDPADASTPIQRWDVGVVGVPGATFDATATGNTTNALTSVALVNANPGSVSYVAPDPNNIGAGIDGTTTAALGGVGFVNPQDFAVDSLMWRNNTNVSFPVIVAHMVPVNLLADYHLLSPSTTFARGAGVASATFGPVTVPAPALDIDGDTRGPGYDRGADQLSTSVDFGIIKTASATTVSPGGAISYTVTAVNNGPVAGPATITDTLPAGVSGTWSIAYAGGASGPATAASLNPGVTVTLPVNAVAVFTLVNGLVANNKALGPMSNTATVTPAANSGLTDTNPANNSSTATVTVQITGNLKVVVTGPGPIVNRGQVLPYVITITNTGTTTMQESFAGVHVGSVSGGGTWTCAGTLGSSCGSFALGFGDIPTRVITVTAGATVTFTYFPAAFVGWTVPNAAAFGSVITETGTLTPNVPNYIDTNSADNTSTLTSTVQARINVALTNTSNATNPQGSANYTYTVRLTNTGVDQALGVQVSNLVPAGVVFIGWSCTTTGGTNSSCPGGASTGAVSRTVNVAGGGGTVTFSITARRVTTPTTTHGLVNSTASAVLPSNANQSGTLSTTAAVTFS